MSLHANGFAEFRPHAGCAGAQRCVLLAHSIASHGYHASHLDGSSSSTEDRRVESFGKTTSEASHAKVALRESALSTARIRLL